MAEQYGSFYPWQVKAWERIRNRDAVLAAPTGSGKTWVAYLWSGLMDLDGHIWPPDTRRIIFTAPIKALSNERYLELRRMGLDVGIETGDFKKNENAPVICCTQEIYTLKYAGSPGLRVVIDEFHYIFDDPDRARTYIEGIVSTNPDSPILVMSATFGGARSVGDYLGEITGRPFTVYEGQERVTKLVFTPKKPATLERLHDALVFCFSQKGAVDLAYKIARRRPRKGKAHRQRLYELAEILDVRDVHMPLLRGVGVYHGGMLPKEKLLVESAFRERILDVVCGTNALALGVNLPAKYVIFAQLVRYHDREPISRNEFLQMAGRAGRKGLFETGYVTWLNRSPQESKGFDTGKVFRQLTAAPPERASVTLRPDYGRLLKGRRTISDEAEYIADFSLPHGDERIVEGELRRGLKFIERSIREMVTPDRRERFREILADIWYGEMEIGENLEMACLFLENGKADALTAAQVINLFEKSYLKSLLKVKRFSNHLPPGYEITGMRYLDRTVEEIDGTIYGFEEKIQEIEDSSL
ncbi:MAG: helicase-related protein [Synergistales bacterium]|nr:helicase-related protein [Synergistales bacterium]